MPASEQLHALEYRSELHPVHSQMARAAVMNQRRHGTRASAGCSGVPAGQPAGGAGRRCCGGGPAVLRDTAGAPDYRAASGGAAGLLSQDEVMTYRSSSGHVLTLNSVGYAAWTPYSTWGTALLPCEAALQGGDVTKQCVSVSVTFVQQASVGICGSSGCRARHNFQWLT